MGFLGGRPVCHGRRSSVRSILPDSDLRFERRVNDSVSLLSGVLTDAGGGAVANATTSRISVLELGGANFSLRFPVRSRGVAAPLERHI